MRSGLRSLLCGLITLLALAAVPALAQASVQYGFSVPGPGDDGIVDFANGSAYGYSFSSPYSTSCYFQLLTPLGGCGYHSTHPFTYVRFLVPWDIAGYSTVDSGVPTASDCADSSDLGGQAFAALVNSISVAESEGMTPMITLGTADSSSYHYYPSDQDFFCAVYTLMYWLNDVGTPVRTWSTFNEPNNNDSNGGVWPNSFVDDYTNPYGSGSSDCSTYGNVVCAADASADLYHELVRGCAAAAAAGSGDGSDWLIAGEFADPEQVSNFMNEFVARVGDWTSACGVSGCNTDPAPTRWSYHPYNDVSCAGTNNYAVTHDTLNAVNGFFPGALIWADETADNLDYCVQPNGQPLTDGSDQEQIDAANAWATGIAGQSSQIGRVFWYEYRIRGVHNNLGLGAHKPAGIRPKPRQRR